MEIIRYVINYLKSKYDLTWSKNYIITDETTQDVHPYANSPASKIRIPTGATLAITDANFMFHWLLYQLKMIINY